MPNWKKVITSGSNAHLNHITASGNISASGNIFGYSASFDSRVGIGVKDPDAKLEIVSDGTTSATKALEIKDSGGQNLFYVRNDGVTSVTHGYFFVQASSGMYVTGKTNARGGVTDDQGVLGLGASGDVDDVIIGLGGHVTASGNFSSDGNISSSGHFIGTHKGVGSGAANKVFFEGDGGPAKLASKDQSTTYLNFGQDSLGIIANGEDTFNVDSNGLVRVGTTGESHGTNALQVYGDISCSGNIHLEPGNLNQTVFVTTGSAGTDTIRFGIGTALGETPGKALTVSGSISSSYNSTGSFGHTHTGTITLTRGADGTDRSGYPGNFYMGSNNIIKTDDGLHIVQGLNVNSNKFVVSNNPNDDEDVEIDGNLKISSHITSSGVISASGGFVGDGSNITGITATADADSISGSFGNQRVGTTDNVKFNNITASGDISSSGQLIAASADFKEGNISNVGTIQLDSIVSDANSNTEIVVGNTQVQTDVDGNTVLTLDSNKVTVGDTVALGLLVDTHITASGNISSSGIGTFNSLVLPSGGLIDNPATDVLRLYNSGLVNVGTQLTVTGDIKTTSHITASGDISSSGRITADNLVLNSNAFATIHIPNEGTIALKDALTDSGLVLKDTYINFGSAATGTTFNINGTAGHITASGNISGSGTTNDLFMKRVFVKDRVSTPEIYADGNLSIEPQGGNTSFLSHITASGNISSSGLVQGLNVKGTNSVQVGGSAITMIPHASDSSILTTFGTNALSVTSHITASGVISASGGFVGDGSNITGITATADADSISGSWSRGVDITGNITASGNISSSRNVISDKVITSKVSNHNVMVGDIDAAGGEWNLYVKGDNGVIISDDTSGLTPAKELHVEGGIKATDLLIGGTISSSGALMGVTHITASGNISSSGRITADSIVNKGIFLTSDGRIYEQDNTGLVIGSSPTDITFANAPTRFEGNITASGNISSSGDFITATRYDIEGEKFAARQSAGVFEIGQGGVSSLDLTNITASGDISSSGNITALDLNLLGGDIDLKNAGAQSNIKFYCESSNAHHTKLQAPAHADYSGDVTTTLPAYDFTFKEPFFDANVTASGNISASGNLIGNQLIIGGGTFTSASLASGGSGGGSADNLGNHTATQDLDLGGNDIFDIQHITASGNISASGKITTSEIDLIGSGTAELEVDGHITASGNISSSGTIQGASLTVDDITINGSTISDAADLLLDAGGDITLDAAGDDIYFKDNGTTRFTFHIDSTPEIDAIGNFALNSTGDITIDSSTGNITVKDNGGNYSPSSDYHIATKKYVDDNGGGGVSFPTTEVVSSSNALMIGHSGSATSGYISGSNGSLEISGSGLGLSVGDWTDGYHGNDEFIPMLPQDFILSKVSTTRNYGVWTDQDGGSTKQIGPSVTSTFASYIIPKGFTATSVDLYSNSNDTFECFSSSLSVGTAGSVGVGTTNTLKDITDVVGDGSQYVIVEWDSDNASDELYGGKIYIERT